MPQFNVSIEIRKGREPFRWSNPVNVTDDDATAAEASARKLLGDRFKTRGVCVRSVVRAGDVRHGQEFQLAYDHTTYRRAALAEPTYLASPYGDLSQCIAAIDTRGFIHAIHADSSAILL